MGSVRKQNGTSQIRLFVGACEVWGVTAEAGGVEVGERLWPGCVWGPGLVHLQACVGEGRQGMSPRLVCDGFPTLLKKLLSATMGLKNPPGAECNPTGCGRKWARCPRGPSQSLTSRKVITATKSHCLRGCCRLQRGRCKGSESRERRQQPAPGRSQPAGRRQEHVSGTRGRRAAVWNACYARKEMKEEEMRNSGRENEQSRKNKQIEILKLKNIATDI